MTPDSMLTIAWDVDDVLNDLMRVWLEEKWLPEHPGCALRYGDIVKNPPHEILGISLESYLASLDAFRLSIDFMQMPPVKEVRDWFSASGHLFRHVAVTAVPMKAAHVSAAWVMRHFGPWIRTFHVVPSPREGEQVFQYDQDKAAFLKWIGKIDLSIDDAEANLSQCQQAGIRGLAFPRPWNRNVTTITQTLDSLTDLSS